MRPNVVPGFRDFVVRIGLELDAALLRESGRQAWPTNHFAWPDNSRKSQSGTDSGAWASLDGPKARPAPSSQEARR